MPRKRTTNLFKKLDPAGNLHPIWWGISVILLIIVILGVWAVAGDRLPKQKSTTITKTEATKVISYSGENDKTVLELLEANNEVNVQKSDLGIFITEINGLANSDNEFWIYYVNDEIGLTSADKYVTKDGDKIEWRYESIK